MAEDLGLRLKKLYTAVHDFLTEKEIAHSEHLQHSRLHRFAHFWLLALKSFYRNKCALRATALAYTTLLALVPMLAIGVGVTTTILKEKGTETTRSLIEGILDKVPGLKAIPMSERADVVNKVEGFISNIQPKTLGITGMIGLVVVAILLLSTIENTFNDIWGVTHGRSWFRRIVQYWTTISLGPVVLTILVIYVSKAFKTGEQALSTLPFLGHLVIPFLMVSLSFAIFYKLMPNTQVDWVAALVGGAMGGTFWLVLNIVNAMNVSRVASMSAIYGSVLAIIPIFLIGLYFSWLIMLFGAQVAYAYQNRQVYLQEKMAESISHRSREYVALRMMTFLAERFRGQQPPPTLLQVASELGVPSRLVGIIMQRLNDSNLVLEIAGKVEGYTLARPAEDITCQNVLQALRVGGGRELETRDDASRATVCSEFERISKIEEQAASAVTLKELVERVPQPGERNVPPGSTVFWKQENGAKADNVSQLHSKS